MWYSICDACPNACWHVVLVKHPDTNRLLAYRRDFGAAWATPSDLTENSFVIASRVLPSGAAQPTQNDIANSEWEPLVHAEVTEDQYGTVADINNALETECRRMAEQSGEPEPPITRNLKS
jgi:hypothetical protein